MINFDSLNDPMIPFDDPNDCSPCQIPDCEETFERYIGRRKIIDFLRIYVAAAKLRRNPLDHILLSGPEGMGKETLAKTIAHEMGVHIRKCSIEELKDPGNLAAVLTNLEEADIVYAEDLHKISSSVLPALYEAMETFCVNILIGKGPSANRVRIDLPRFTVIGAVTDPSLLPEELKNSFPIEWNLGPYPPEELTAFILREAGECNLQITEQGALELAKQSNGLPRTARRLLRRVRDFAQVNHSEPVDRETALQALQFLGVIHGQETL